MVAEASIRRSDTFELVFTDERGQRQPARLRVVEWSMPTNNISVYTPLFRTIGRHGCRQTRQRRAKPGSQYGCPARGRTR